MSPQTETALLVLVAFVLPGFVALLVAERTHVVPVRNRSPFELLLLATYYSVVCWGLIALASWPFHLTHARVVHMWRHDSLGRLAGLGLLAILVVPTLVANVARLWQRSKKWRARAPAGAFWPTALECFCNRRRCVPYRPTFAVSDKAPRLSSTDGRAAGDALLEAAAVGKLLDRARQFAGALLR
jgi:hypothetical protein